MTQANKITATGPVVMATVIRDKLDLGRSEVGDSMLRPFDCVIGPEKMAEVSDLWGMMVPKVGRVGQKFGQICA